jgi:hypothetical protein
MLVVPHEGRTHAVTNGLKWEKDLQSVGYGHVDWTDGERPENNLERLSIATASADRCERMQIFSPTIRSADLPDRQAIVDQYVQTMTEALPRKLYTLRYSRILRSRTKHHNWVAKRAFLIIPCSKLKPSELLTRKRQRFT